MVLNCRTAADAIREAKLDWRVSLRDIFFKGKDGDHQNYDDSKAIVREDTESVLGIVGARYVPIQNEEVFSFLDKFVDTDEARYKKAESYRNGRVLSVYLSLGKGDVHTIRDGDDIETIIRVVTSHDGSERLQAQLFMMRYTCLNQLTVNKATFAFSTKHTENAKVVMANGRDLIQVARVFGKEFAEKARRMNQTTMSSDAIKFYVRQVLGVDKKKDEDIPTRTLNKIEEIRVLAVRGKGNTGRTLWDAYNGVTEYADHYITVKGDNDHLTSSVLGSGRTLKDRAYDIAEKLIVGMNVSETIHSV